MIFTITLALRQHGTSTAVIGLMQAAIAVGGLPGAWAVGAFAAMTAVAAVLCLILPGLRQAPRRKVWLAARRGQGAESSVRTGRRGPPRPMGCCTADVGFAGLT